MIYWEKNAGLNCRFCDIFRPLPAGIVTMKEVNRKPYRFYNPKDVKNRVVSILLQKYQQYHFDKTLYVEDVSRMLKAAYPFEELGYYQSVLIESHSHFFYPKQRPLYQHFTPLPAIEAKINKISQQFSPNTVGVHIRRVDHQKAIKGSPLELFVQVMKKEIEMNGDTNFFVASDDKQVKFDLLAKFGDKILLTTPEKGERNTKKGVIHAVVDLYALSRTKKVLGSYGSSFSHTAGHISGIEEVVINEKLLPSVYKE